MARFEINEGRDSLSDLDLDALYIVEGTYAAQYESTKKRSQETARYTFTEVIVKEYDKSVSLQDSPVVGFADHLNTIRKTAGMQYAGLKQDQRFIYVGRLQEYSVLTGEGQGILRRTFKLLRDPDPGKALESTAKRLRNLSLRLEEHTVKTAQKHLATTRKNLDRVASILSSQDYVPYQTEQQFRALLNRQEQEFRTLSKRVKA